MLMADPVEEPAELVQQLAAKVVERELSPQAALLDLPHDRVVEIVRRGAGRPQGSRSRRTEDTAKAVIERFGDPLLRQVAIATMPIAELMALGLRFADALAEQRLAAVAVLPYLHQRQAIAVDVSTHRTVNLTIFAGLPTGQGSGPAEIMGVVVNQALSEAPDDAV